MKKLKTLNPGFTEIRNYCDSTEHNDIEAGGQLKLHFWYGSKYDGNAVEVCVCDECGEEMIKLLKEKFGKNIKEYELL